MKDNYNIDAKEIKNMAKQARNTIKKDTQDYCYYSKVLKEPFDSIEALKEAEEVFEPVSQLEIPDMFPDTVDDN